MTRYVLTDADSGKRSWQPERPVPRIFHVTDSAGQCLLGCQACAAARHGGKDVLRARPKSSRAREGKP